MNVREKQRDLARVFQHREGNIKHLQDLYCTSVIIYNSAVYLLKLDHLLKIKRLKNLLILDIFYNSCFFNHCFNFLSTGIINYLKTSVLFWLAKLQNFILGECETARSF